MMLMYDSGSEVSFLDCHSGLDPESSLLNRDSRFRGKDGFGVTVKKSWKY
jgi:hypothetical protein